jgi:psiF repeat-containing protein
MRQLLALTVLSLFACGAYAADAKMTPQQEKMKTCNDQASDKKGDDRKAFMKTCLSAKAEKPKSKMAMCNEKTKGMTKDEAAKARSECMKAG